MLLTWAYLSLLLFASATNALRNDRQLRHLLETDFGHKTPAKRSFEDVAFSVEVI